MNCFEARKEFIRFWRRTLPIEQRDAFNAHLRECTRCDRAFRLFALSAPVLQSDTEPAPTETWESAKAPRRRYAEARPVPAQPSERSRPFAAIGAALAIAAAALLFVSFSNVPAYQSLASTLSSDSQAESISGSDISLLGPNVNAAEFNPGSAGVLGQATPAEEITVPALGTFNPDENSLAD